MRNTNLVDTLREGDPVQLQAAEYIEALRKVAQAGADLCNCLQEQGDKNDNWKALANAIRSLPTR